MTNLEKLKKDLTADGLYEMVSVERVGSCAACPVAACRGYKGKCEELIKEWCAKEAEE